MGVSPLHRLAKMIAEGEYINDNELIDTLGRDGTIVVPLHGGTDRRLPSGEILSVLAESSGRTVSEVLARSFRMDEAEIESANAFINLVQFAGDEPASGGPEEQPFQALDN